MSEDEEFEKKKRKEDQEGGVVDPTTLDECMEMMKVASRRFPRTCLG